MDYITVAQAAQKWNITQRAVQKYCSGGRIPGAEKFGNCWRIPADCTKPIDPRKAKIIQMHFDDSCPGLLPIMSASFEPGHCMELIESIKEKPIKDIAMAEYYYYTAQHDLAAAIAEEYILYDKNDIALSACLLYAYSNLTLNRGNKTGYAVARVKAMANSMDEDTPPALRAAAATVYTALNVLMHFPLPDDLPSVEDFLTPLPSGMRIFALYVQAHHLYNIKEYHKSIGVIETSFAFGANRYPIASIYLHLAAVMNYMAIKDFTHANNHLMAAYKVAVPDDFIEPFGEHHDLLGGMLESVLKSVRPGWFGRITDIANKFTYGWKIVHNAVTGNTIAYNLTTTEFTVAIFAARGWTNAEIANHMNMSPHTLKRYVSNILKKLGVNKRSEIKKHMLD